MYVYRYIKDTNIKNSAQDLNACITKLAPDVMTWTPKPGSVLDLGVALRDPTNRLKWSPQTLCVFFPMSDYGKGNRLFPQSGHYNQINHTCLRSLVFKQTVGFATSCLLVIITLYHHHDEETEDQTGCLANNLSRLSKPLHVVASKTGVGMLVRASFENIQMIKSHLLRTSHPFKTHVRYVYCIII